MSEFDPRRTPWHIDDSDFYEIDDRRAQIEFLVRYAVLAPSGHNTQPWSFRIVADGVEVYADLTRRLSVVDAANRELFMSVGAAITNLRVAAAHFGYETTALYPPHGGDTDPCALVAIRETCCPDTSYSRLFPAITKRRTNRQPFTERPIDDAALAKLCDFIDEQPDTVRFILPHDRPRIAQLIADGDALLMADPAFRKELAQWMRPNETQLPDGVCGDAFGIPGPLSALGPLLMRSLDLGAPQAKHDRGLASDAPGMLVITADDDRVALIRAGETLESVLLLLTTLGIQYSFLNQPIEVASLRHELASMIRATRPPQLLLRIGYATPGRRPMPRRPLGQVMTR